MDSGVGALLFGCVVLGAIYALPPDWRRFGGGLLVLGAIALLLAG